MPQQINLSTPVFVKPRQYLAARSMGVMGLVFMTVGGVAAVVWGHRMAGSMAALKKTQQQQQQALDAMQAMLKAHEQTVGPAQLEEQKQLQALQEVVAEKERVLSALQQGVAVPGAAHSDRLLWIANSIPAQVWVTDVQADSQQMHLVGMTLEPAALHTWVEQFRTTPLMRGLKLQTVEVERAAAAAPQLTAAQAGAASARPTWRFRLHSTVPVLDTPTSAPRLGVSSGDGQ